MRKLTIFLSLIFMSASFIFCQEQGTQAKILGKSGNNWILDKGSDDGVTIGIKGYFWTKAKSGDKLYPMNIARFSVVNVNDKKCEVALEGMGEGFSEKDFQWAAFIIQLSAPGSRPPGSDAKPQAGKPASNQSNIELAFWESIKESTNRENFKAYLKKFPDGIFTDLAKIKIKELESGAQAETERATQARNAETVKQAAEQKRRDAQDARKKEEAASLGVEMVAIPGGTFQMGSNSSEAYKWEKPVHTVTVSAFYMGKTEVTQGQWKAIMGSNPAKFQNGDHYPVEQVSWDDCQEFIRKLNAKTGKQYRLPTEAEWEYACRAGTSGDRYGDIDAVAWYAVNSGNTTHPVGQKQANAWGLYDMLGNVWEWCSDWYGDYSSAAQDNPVGPASGSDRVLRGGCWINDARIARASLRNGLVPGYRSSNLGFRLAAGSAGN